MNAWLKMKGRADLKWLSSAGREKERESEGVRERGVSKSESQMEKRGKRKVREGKNQVRETDKEKEKSEKYFLPEK